MSPTAGAVPEMVFLLKQIHPAPHVWYESFALVNSFFSFYFDEQRTSERVHLQLNIIADQLCATTWLTGTLPSPPQCSLTLTASC